MRRAAFAPNPGALDMHLYVPAGLAPGAPLVVVLHGCTQTAEAFAGDSGWIALAERSGFAVLAPEQSCANNANRCFNWFQPEDMRRGGGEPASIAAMVDDALKKHQLDSAGVYITGLSAGGAMAAVMLAAYPDMFAGGAIVAGLPYGTAQGIPQAFQTMQGRAGLSSAELAALISRAGGPAGRLPPLSIWHGDADHVVNHVNAGEIARQWAAAQGLSSEPDERAAGSGFERTSWRDGAGTVRIELNRVAGLGHGVPLETRGEHGLGRTGPYMLQAGVSSTLEIARFWGLPDERSLPAEVADHILTHSTPGSGAQPESQPETAAGGLGGQVMSAVAGLPSEVQTVIADALIKSGLLKPRR